MASLRAVWVFDDTNASVRREPPMLINCRECGESVARHAKSCPQCGARKPAQSKAQAKLDDLSRGSFKLAFALPALGIFVLVIVAIVAGVAGC